MKRYILLCLALVCCTFWAQAQSLRVSPSSISVPQGGGTYNFSVSIDTMISMSYAGCTGGGSSNSGNSNGFSVTFGANNNPTTSGTLRVTYNTEIGPLTASVSYTQTGVTKNYSIQATPAALNAPAAGGNVSTSIYFKERTGLATTTCSQVVNPHSSWCTVTYSGAIVTVNCKKNQTGGTRTGTITVKYTNPLNASSLEPATFTVTQPSQVGSVTISPKSTTAPAAGGSVNFSTTFSGVDTMGNLPYRSYENPTGQITAATGSTATFRPNLGNTTLSGTATIYFGGGIYPLVSDDFTYTQAPVAYTLVASRSVTLAAAGGSAKATMNYSVSPRTSETVNMSGGTASISSSGSGWCTASVGAGGVITVNGTANLTSATRTANVTVSYTNPISGGTRPSSVITVTQQPVDYSIQATPASMTAPATGGNVSTSIYFKSRSGLATTTCSQVTNPHTGWCTVTYSGSTVTVNCKANQTGATRTGTITVGYTNPINTASPQKATFTITQPSENKSLALSSKTMTAPATGGTVGYSVTYTGMDTIGTPPFLRYENPTGQITSATGSNVTFRANTGSTTLTGTCTVYFGGGVYPTLSDNFTYTQAPVPYTLVSPKTVTLQPLSGSSAQVTMTYSESLRASTAVTLSGGTASVSSNATSWCTASVGAGGVITVKATSINTEVGIRTADVTVSYTNPITGAAKPSCVIKVSQLPDYSITSDNPVILTPEGGFHTTTLRYVNRSGSVNLAVASIPTWPTWCASVVPNNDGTVTIRTGTNLFPSTNTGEITVTYIHPYGGPNPSCTLTLSQDPVPYTIKPASSSLTFTPGGESKTQQISFQERPGAATTDYKSVSGLPDWCTLSAGSNGLLTLTAQPNQTTGPREATVTVFYNNPVNTSDPESTSFTISQQPVDYSFRFSVPNLRMPAIGDTQIVTLEYVNRPGAVSLTNPSVSSSADWLKVTHLGEGRFQVKCEENTATSARDGSITVSHPNPQGSPATLSTTLYVTQAIRDEVLYLDKQHLTIPAGGSAQQIGFELILNPDDTADEQFFFTSGAPDNCTVTRSSAHSSPYAIDVTFLANPDYTAREGQISVGFKNGDFIYSASFTYYQAAVETVTDQSLTKRLYRDETGQNYNTTVTYYDGLSRPTQTIQVAASPTGHDLVSFLQYDGMGRADSVSYMPYVASTSSGAKASNPLAAQTAFYNDLFPGQGSYARSFKEYNSVGLVTRQNSPGEEYTLENGYITHTNARLNTDNDGIRRYRLVNGRDLRFDDCYPAETLTVEEVIQKKDGLTDNAAYPEKRTLQYKNAQGQLIASEIYISATDRRMTYYVYDEMGRQRYMLPPAQHDDLAAGATYSPAAVATYSYYTEYDEKGRTYRQHVPGSEYTISLYDSRGRLAMSQSGNLRARNQWVYTKYDEFDRPVLTGIATGAEKDHQAALDNQPAFFETRSTAAGNVHGYTNLTYPQVNNPDDCLSITYYDDYDWCGQAHAFRPEEALDGQSTYSTRVIGQTTGTKTKVLGIDETRYLTTAVYFDSDYQTIQSVSDLYNAGAFGTEIVSNAHDFLGTVTDTKVKQTVGTTVTEYTKAFAHDNQGRLQNVKMKVTGDNANNQVTLASYTYNELGQTVTKAIHDSTETTRYTYDLQGRTVGSVSPSFSWWLDFEHTSVDRVQARGDGQISVARWKTGLDNEKAYIYTYDPQNQLLDAQFAEKTGSAWTSSEKLREGEITYDINGNILGITRKSSTGNVLQTVSDMKYNGYKLQKLTFNGTESADYRYDANGNMIFDARVGNSIEYNLLNLPRKVSKESDSIVYIYSASGAKLASKTQSSLTYYRSVMIYDGSNALSLIFQPEGSITKSQSPTPVFTYNYFKTDHVGSTRVMMSAISNGSTIDWHQAQANDFYPFGVVHDDLFNNLSANKYLFNGKEIQDASIYGNMLGIYDYGARYYDPVLGRWFTHDPKLQVPNPYLFCGNSPGMYIDPDGQMWMLAAGLFLSWMGIIHKATKNQFGNFWDFSKAFFPGVAATATGYGVGYWVKEGLGVAKTLTEAIANGAKIGAASGAAAGFVEGASSAWANGAGFGRGLAEGFMGGGIGAATGFITGRWAGAAGFNKQTKEFYRLAASDPTGADGVLIPGNKELADFSDHYLGEATFKDDANDIYDDNRVKSSKKKNAIAYTDPNKTSDGKYNIYYSTAAFKDKLTLFLTMTHEYLHVAQLASNLHHLNNMEYAAYDLEADMLKKAGLQDSHHYKSAVIERNNLRNLRVKTLKHYFKSPKWGLPSAIPASCLP